MNPSLKFILAFLISLEVSIKPSLTINLIVIVAALLFLLIKKIAIKKLLALLIAPLIAAFVIFATLYWFQPHPDHLYAWILSSRIYVYVLTIACVAHTTTSEELARSFEQNLHLPSKFAYGVLAALNIIPRMRIAIKQIRTAGMMRGVYLSFWSPMLYFKAILVALESAENLAQGMESHGYTEGQKRSVITKIPLTGKDWLLFATILAIFNLCLFGMH